MCLARRKNRYSVLIKLCGVCCLVCAATCVLVTVTTTVIHMSRLQSLRECVYTLKTQTCTCYSMLLENESERTDEGAHYVFNSTPNCEVIHGALYSCLRAMFGLSVIGILVCIFCCMLVYQLLSHERKKMYWEQLELRCRYLYGQPRNQPVISPPQRCSHCACSQQFRFPAEGTFENRLWSGGRIGNLYSPNPVGDEPPQSSGWAWRLPWSRSETSHPQPTEPRETMTYNQPINCSSPDSQYGFTAQGVATVSSATSASYTMIEPPPGQVYQWGPPPPYSDPNSPRRACPSVSHSCPSRQSQHPIQGPVQQETYHNVQDLIEQEEVRTVARSARRVGDSCSSSAKSEERMVQRIDEVTSPRVKYLRQNAQSTSTASNPNRKRQEPSESEVYFADVSSCCNGSIRNDSLLYDEPVTPELQQDTDSKHLGRLQQTTPPVRKDVPNKQPRFVPDKSLHAQIEENGSKEDFQKIPEERGSPEAYSEMAHDGSEEDDPELVSFSQRAEARNRISDLTRAQCRNRMDLTQMNGSNDFPSPMSISSPSTGSKEFFPDNVNSDNGSADSVWSRCSPEFLAPDAQYETIPEPRVNPSMKASPSKRRGLSQDWHILQDKDSSVFMQNINSPGRACEIRPNHNVGSPRMRNNLESSFERALNKFEDSAVSGVTEFRASSRFERHDDRDTHNGNLSGKFNHQANLSSPQARAKISNFDRCGNFKAPCYYEEDGKECYDSYHGCCADSCGRCSAPQSPRHHYEEIREPEGAHSPRYETCGHHPQQLQQQRSASRQQMHASQDFCVSGRKEPMTINSASVDSPKLFDKRLFGAGGPMRGSPECIALVDESLCSHNDSSCRCSLSLNKCVIDEPNH
ncbi:Hypothetical protein NTJ_08622 [Nesidiocoris tenuis]|uniref:WAP domain-containing protein n=1 Tax=Nesidiocoris tenuis TaxID=355587 RepID=A0ABN7AUF3_9HEMI|nr:Hypothetical protein NTJ_08622 [Nesidiocoris tenuis]